MGVNNSRAFNFIISILEEEQPGSLYVEDSDEFLKLVKHNRFQNLLLHLQPNLHLYLPQKTFRKLSEMSQNSKMESFQKAALLKDLVQELKKNNIPFVVLKGIPLSIQLYHHFSIKHSFDIDILIDIHDYKKMNYLLKQKGFSSKYKLNKLNIFNYHDFVYQKNNLLLELHSRFFNNRFLLPFDKDYLKHTESVLLGTEAVPVLKKSIHYLYLIAHSQKHNFERLFWTFDALQFRNIMSESDLKEAKDYARSVGLRDLFFDYERLTMRSVASMYRPVPHKGLERFLFLLKINSKWAYKAEECLQRLFIPYRLLNN